MTNNKLPTENEMRHALAFWERVFQRQRPDKIIAGSPERCLCRTVIEDVEGNLLLLEEIAPDTKAHKQSIITTLHFLHRQGLKKINPCMETRGGETIIHSSGRLWQLSRFIEGIPMRRPSYVRSAVRGHALAKFLLELDRCARRIDTVRDTTVFSLRLFIEDLMDKLRHHRPEIHTRVLPTLNFIRAGALDIHDRFPVRFCHGDYHPLNVIWSRRDIRAVIDWEFCGFKPEWYDVANLIGCIGMEDPKGLAGPLVLELISCLKGTQYLSDQSWNSLLSTVVALRFAWLSEWLRCPDEAMIELEITYMALIQKYAGKIEDVWNRETDSALPHFRSNNPEYLP